MSNNHSHTKGCSIFILFILLLSFIGIFVFLEESDFTNLSEVPATPTPSAYATETAGPTDSVSTQETTSPTAVPTEDNTQTITGVQTLPVYPVSSKRVTYAEGFYYEPVAGNTALMDRIRNLSYNESINTQVTYDSLSYVRVKYIDFENKEQEGELVCNTLIASDLVEIFHDLHQAKYQIQSIRLIDDFGADDDTSMEANNTSCFNYRYMTNSKKVLSNHSDGTAIDINPLYNPYVVGTYKGATVIPASASAYADRTQDFNHKIDEDDLCYQLFTEHGFTWGGSWSSVKDYQHFEKKIGY